MKQIVVSALLFLKLAHFSLAQTQTGSFCIIAVCKDGIVLGCDSRGAFVKDARIGHAKDSGNVLAFHDNVQKIKVLNNFLIGATGTNIARGRYIFSYLDEFRQSGDTSKNVLTGIRSLYTFLQQRYPFLVPVFTQEMSVMLGGYNGETPVAARINRDGTLSTATGKGWFSSGGPKTMKYFNYTVNASCEAIAKMIKKEIEMYPLNEKQDKYLVGGPTMVVKISKGNKITWLYNRPTKQNPNTMQQFYEQYKKGEIKMMFPDQKNKKPFEDLLDLLRTQH